ncbi:MAG: hypothetical protein K5769_04405 [Pseudobutyrivibrio sp.]|nr:hypothetical protein [Pseudobutyrivibrio sp.]
MKIIKYFLRAIGILLVGFIIFYIVGIPICNNHYAKSTMEDILEVPLPDSTTLKDKIYYAGKIAGNGNGMQYFGAILIESNLSLEELKSYYSELTDDKYTYCVEKQTSAKIEQSENVMLSFDTKVEGGNYYIVYSWGSAPSLFEDSDLRGH